MGNHPGAGPTTHEAGLYGRQTHQGRAIGMPMKSNEHKTLVTMGLRT